MSAPLAQPARMFALALAGGVLAGCGEPAEPAPARDGVISLTQRDYRLHPQAVVASRGRVRVDVVNRGRLPHALRLKLHGRERLKIPTLLPGERGSATARLPAGSYRVLCPIANHEELGMYGTLTVR